MHGTGSLSVRELCRRLRSGSIEPRTLIDDCRQRIATRDVELRAWEHVLSESEIRTALTRHALQKRPLAGLPIGVKDIIDVAGQPTRHGSTRLHAHWPSRDAEVVAQLRRAGALVLGKTCTSAFAYRYPTRTRNPSDLERSPGGSSSGSAAAVADEMVPVAIGTQTGGSVIRPAAYCGVVGYKPTTGKLPLRGVQPLAPSCDAIGFFGRRVDDVRFIGEQLHILRPRARRGPNTRPLLLTQMRWMRATAGEVPCKRFAAFLTRAAAAGWNVVDKTDLDRVREVADDESLFHSEAGRFLGAWLGDRTARVEPEIRRLIALGARVSAEKRARAQQNLLAAAVLCSQLLQPSTVLVTLAAPGEAPRFGTLADSNRLNRAWSALHLPVVTVPFDTGASGLPLGLQIVGRWNQDEELLEIAEAVERLP